MAQATSGSDPEEESDAHNQCDENKQEPERQETEWQWRGCMRPLKWDELIAQLRTDFMFRFISQKFIHKYGIYWKRTQVFYHLQMYSSIQWLPLNLSSSSERRTTRIITDWQTRDAKLQNLSLYDIYHCGYRREENGIIYLDIIFKNKWFTGLNLSKKKIYFYRKQFHDTKEGRRALRSTAIKMAARLNLVYLAWFKMTTLMPSNIKPYEIPIIAWSNDSPTWMFIPIAPKKQIEPIINVNTQSGGLRRSARLAENSAKTQQSSEKQSSTGKYGPAMQRWLNGNQ